MSMSKRVNSNKLIARRRLYSTVQDLLYNKPMLKSQLKNNKFKVLNRWINNRIISKTTRKIKVVISSNKQNRGNNKKLIST